MRQLPSCALLTCILCGVSGCGQGAAGPAEKEPNLAARRENVPPPSVRPIERPTMSATALPPNFPFASAGPGSPTSSSGESRTDSTGPPRSFSRDSRFSFRGPPGRDGNSGGGTGVTPVVPRGNGSERSDGNREDNSRNGGSRSDNGRKYQPPTLPAGLPPWFTERDKDNDGQLAMFEWPNDQLEEFSRYDRNKDGFVTAPEVLRILKPPPTAVAANGSTASTNGSTSAPASAATAAATPASATGVTPVPPPATPMAAAPLAVTAAAASPPPAANTSPSEDDRYRRYAAEQLRQYDRNNDGKIDQQEVQATRMMKYSWQNYDANKDSALDADEIMAYLKAQSRGPGGGGGSGSSGRGPGGGDSRGSGSGGGAGDMLSRMDRNRDGKLSRDEMPGFFANRFDEWDKNRDGFVDAEEMAAAFSGPRRDR